jgi:hypothetical protein
MTDDTAVCEDRTMSGRSTLTIVNEQTQELVLRRVIPFKNEPVSKTRAINVAIGQAIVTFANSTMFSDKFNEGADREAGTMEAHFSSYGNYDDEDRSPAYKLDNLEWHDLDSVEIDAITDLFETLE